MHVSRRGIQFSVIFLRVYSHVSLGNILRFRRDRPVFGQWVDNTHHVHELPNPVSRLVRKGIRPPKSYLSKNFGRPDGRFVFFRYLCKLHRSKTNMDLKDKIVIYRTADGQTAVDVRMDGDTVWLSQAQMAELFQKDRTVIGRHINNIFKEGELDKSLVCANFAHTKEYGRREGFTQTKNTIYYNLDEIISVGYRVKSRKGCCCSIWSRKTIPSATATSASPPPASCGPWPAMASSITLMARSA